MIRSKILGLSIVLLISLAGCSNDASENTSSTTSIVSQSTTVNFVQGNLVGNLCPGGKYTALGSTLFFQSADGSGLIYKSNLDGSGKSTLNADTKGYSLNVNEEWLFFISTINNGIYKIKHDGTSIQRIGGESTTAAYLLLDGDWLYYASNEQDNTKMARIKIDGTGDTKILGSSVGSINVSGKTIYFSDITSGGQLSAINVNGKSLSQKYKDIAEFVNYSNGFIYYRNLSDDGRLYKIPSNGGQNQALTTNPVSNVIVQSNFIYFIDNSEQGGIKKMNIDGTGETMLLHGKADSLHLIGDYLYYRNGNDGFKPYRIKTDGSGNIAF